MIKYSKIRVEHGGDEKLETVEASTGDIIQRLTTWREYWGARMEVEKGDWKVNGKEGFDNLNQAKAYVRGINNNRSQI